jgi:hypothetical protein
MASTSPARRRVPLQKLLEPSKIAARRLILPQIPRLRRANFVGNYFELSTRRPPGPINSSSVAVDRAFIKKFDITFPPMAYHEDIFFWSMVGLRTSVALSRSKTVVVAQHSESAMATAYLRHRDGFKVDCTAFVHMPVYAYLTKNFDQFDESQQQIIALYLDGYVTQAWKSTIYLGLQECARSALKSLRYPRRLSTLPLRIVAKMPRRVAEPTAILLQRLRSLDRHNPPLSPFLDTSAAM